MAAQISITNPNLNSGNPIRVLCNQVTISGKKNINDDPYVNGDGLTEVHTQSYDNPKYVVQGINFVSASGLLAYTDVLYLYKNKYDTTAISTTTLKIVYGNGTQQTVVGTDGTTTNIKVVMESFNFPIDAKETKGGYIPVGSITFIETL